jgi:hypothetical protein
MCSSGLGGNRLTRGNLLCLACCVCITCLITRGTQAGRHCNKDGNHTDEQRAHQ